MDSVVRDLAWRNRVRAAAHRHQAGEPLRGDRVGGGCDARVEAARVQLDGRIACDEAALVRVRGVPGWRVTVTAIGLGSSAPCLQGGAPI
eukprot:scaffold41958_cov60-Phaeocystis_antarctica.AAC.1